jgi:SAM-dependent methyltransferase
MSIADEALFVATTGSLFELGRSFRWNLVSTRLTQFSYFDELLGSPAWKTSKILDFGGNIGTFLKAAGDNVAHENYWCVDLNPAVVEEGRRLYPRAHFVHYNRYSSQYNPNGVRRLPVPDCGVKFDIILAFSVFTHTDRIEMLELVASLRRLLTFDGVLAFTFTDPHYDKSLTDPAFSSGAVSIEPHFVSQGDEEQARLARWYILIDNELYVEPGDDLCIQTRTGKPLEAYTSYFTADYVSTLFPEGTVLPPVRPEWQHCCVIRNSAG